MKTWFITGISRGLGFALAKAALDRGDAVVGTVRAGAPDLPGAKVLTVDLAKQTSLEDLVASAFAHTGTIDVIVNNAGYGLLGATEHATDDELNRLFTVDLFAPIKIVRAAVPKLRAQGSGHIINITSIAGRAPGVGSALYSAAKAGLEGFSAGIAHELAPFGVKVTTIAPGGFRTDFLTPHSIAKSNVTDAYDASVNKGLAAWDAANGKQPGDPVKAAAAILKIADAEKPPLHLLLGSDAYKRTIAKNEAVAAEMDAWVELTKSTDY